MILTREMIAAVSRPGGVSISCKSPSTSIAHAQLVLEGLDMDIRCPRLDGPADQLVDEADHRRFARHVLQPLGIIAAVVSGVPECPRCLAEGLPLRP